MKFEIQTFNTFFFFPNLNNFFNYNHETLKSFFEAEITVSNKTEQYLFHQLEPLQLGDLTW